MSGTVGDLIFKGLFERRTVRQLLKRQSIHFIT